MLTHEQLVARMLKNPAVRTEHERLEREEFALLDEMLAARRAAGLTQAQVAERMGPKPPLWRGWRTHWLPASTRPAWIRCANTPRRWANG